MKVFVSWLSAAVVLSTIALVAQSRPLPPAKPPGPVDKALQPEKQPAKAGGSISVEGCMSGTTLEPVKDDVILTTYGVHQYDLRTSRALNERLRGHQGHTERVIGTLELPQDPDRVTYAKSIGGKTQIAASTSPSAGTQGTPVIAVTSVEHIADKCGIPPKRDPNPARTGSAIVVPQ